MMNIPAKELGAIIASGATILDVRNPSEHAAQRLAAAHELVPLDRLDPADFMLRRGLDAGAPVYLLCRSGMRAGRAVGLFADAGYKNVYVIDGGILACDPALTEGTDAAAAGAAAPAKKKMTIEEQVRFIAGMMVMLGLFLGLVVKPAFFLLAFITGIGLAYSGATGDCRLALLLAKAPWNKNLATPACRLSHPLPQSLPQTPDKPTAGGCA